MRWTERIRESRRRRLTGRIAELDALLDSLAQQPEMTAADVRHLHARARGARVDARSAEAYPRTTDRRTTMTRRLTLLERLEHTADQTVSEIVKIDERLGEIAPILSELEKLQAEQARLIARREKIEPVATSTSALIVAMTAAQNGSAP